MKQADVVIIGGGPAGLAAANRLFENGVTSLVLLEREKQLGGILRQCVHDGFGLERFGQTMSGPEYAQREIEKLHSLQIPYRTNASVIRVTGERIVTVVTQAGMEEWQAKAVILAMGCRERTRGQLATPGERPSGVFTAGVAQAYINLYNRMPGREVVMLGSGDVGLIMARRLTLEGAHVKGVYEILPTPSGLARNVRQCLEDFDIPLHLHHTVVDVHGADRLTGVTVAKVDDQLRPIAGTEEHIDCDTLILSVGLIPENELTRGAGAQMNEKTGGPLVDDCLQTTVKGIFVTGNALFVHDLADAVSMEAESLADTVAAYVREGALQPCRCAKAPTPPVYPLDGGFPCVVCPNSCWLKTDEKGEITGYRCVRGRDYAIKEMTAPVRTLTTSVAAEGAALPLCSVRLNRAIPKERLMEMMAEIRKIHVKAPVHAGTVLLKHPLGLDTEMIATREMEEQSNGTSL